MMRCNKYIALHHNTFPLSAWPMVEERRSQVVEADQHFL